MSVVDIIKRQGRIVLTHTGVYPFPAQLLPIKKLGKPIAMFKNGTYGMEATIKGLKELQIVQSDSHHNWVIEAKATRISSRPKTENANYKKPARPTTAPTMQEPNM